MDDADSKQLVTPDTRVFRTKAEVYRTDPEVGVYWENPVPVYGLDGKLIGAASLSHFGGTVRANIVMEPHSPERLDIETGKLWAWPDCLALVVEGLPVDHVVGIQLSRHIYDYTIGPCGAVL
jgi:hypothetical protein